MKVYLIRHGQTNGNVARRHQAEHTPLSAIGETQAKAVATKICALEPTHVVTSNLVRAIETARQIGTTCDLIPETSELFAELRRPKHLAGQYHWSFASLWYYLRWYLHTAKDSETYPELRTRLQAAQAKLASYPTDSQVVVVSHTVFINFFLAHLCREKNLSAWSMLLTFHKMLLMPNATVTELEFDESAPVGTCAWRVHGAT